MCGTIVTNWITVPCFSVYWFWNSKNRLTSFVYLRVLVIADGKNRLKVQLFSLTKRFFKIYTGRFKFREKTVAIWKVLVLFHFFILFYMINTMRRFVLYYMTLWYISFQKNYVFQSELKSSLCKDMTKTHLRWNKKLPFMRRQLWKAVWSTEVHKIKVLKMV